MYLPSVNEITGYAILATSIIGPIAQPGLKADELPDVIHHQININPELRNGVYGMMLPTAFFWLS